MDERVRRVVSGVTGATLLVLLLAPRPAAAQGVSGPGVFHTGPSEHPAFAVYRTAETALANIVVGGLVTGVGAWLRGEGSVAAFGWRAVGGALSFSGNGREPGLGRPEVRGQGPTSGYRGDLRTHGIARGSVVLLSGAEGFDRTSTLGHELVHMIQSDLATRLITAPVEQYVWGRLGRTAPVFRAVEVSNGVQLFNRRPFLRFLEIEAERLQP